MADVPDLTGEGTLYDTDEIELAAVAYRVQPTVPTEGGLNKWGGELLFPDPTMMVDPGRYVLELADGTRVDIDIAPIGSIDGDSRHVEFTGVGVFGRDDL